MSNFSRWKVVSVSTAIALSAVISLNLALAQPKPAAKGAAGGPPAKAKGRLPPYYKDIVDARQKEEIYSIQVDFNTKIDGLKEQIEKLVADRDAAIEKVLSPQQKDKLKKAQEVAAGNRKKPDADKPANGGTTAE